MNLVQVQKVQKVQKKEMKKQWKYIMDDDQVQVIDIMVIMDITEDTVDQEVEINMEDIVMEVKEVKNMDSNMDSVNSSEIK
eukprot:CAMPEP_0201565374 /NCGR_PEP_ID=MMETSP0190_2-20130828/4452_1 /ASSEMBLY_ACC=CAM_ASM_000263 /TAXON_ID=37353 /ORGANISM="Rosalina sp." /LENGTH=80 /DNA_ID=CAMNT_0047982773 /DNA_START=395 /DNA_END=637 /DNA_ORIENTATION=+